LREILPLLQRLKYKEFEVEFGKRVQEISTEVRAELPPSPSAGQLPPSASRAAQLARVSPRAAVLDAWLQVESAALSAAHHLGGERFRDRTLSYQAVRHLEQLDKLDRGVVSLLRELRGLRNEAAHAPDFALSEASALDYADAAERVASYLRSIAGDA
jgi:hypothetical protein